MGGVWHCTCIYAPSKLNLHSTLTVWLMFTIVCMLRKGSFIKGVKNQLPSSGAAAASAFSRMSLTNRGRYVAHNRFIKSASAVSNGAALL